MRVNVGLERMRNRSVQHKRVGRGWLMECGG